jgi:phosphatidylglycerol---prolipoprotein diacylglyceryl transferase
MGGSQTAYLWLMLAAIAISAFTWKRMAKKDDRLVFIYVSALGGAFLGAKLSYLFAEGWMHWHDPNRWVILLTGKSISGALIGGYVAVEAVKKLLGYTQTTGDRFAIIVPASIVLGRIGCVLHGCCLGRICDPSWYTMTDIMGDARWPAALVELIFNAVFLVVTLVLQRLKILPGQQFHLYLISYGAFRFMHEFMRDTPRIAGPITGYQIVSLLILGLGVFGYVNRRAKILGQI